MKKVFVSVGISIAIVAVGISPLRNSWLVNALITLTGG